MSNSFNRQIENYGIGKDLFRSIVTHTVIILIILVLGLVENIIFSKNTKNLVVNGNNLQNSSKSLTKVGNQVNTNSQPVQASLVDQKFVQEAIKRQDSEAKQQIFREKKLKQQEQQLAQLKKIAEQEALKLKQEKENIKKEAEKTKKDQEQIKKQHQELQQTTEQLKQQAKDLALQKEKLAKLQSKQLAEKKNSQLSKIDHQKLKNNLSNSQASPSTANSYSSLGSGGMSSALENEIMTYQAAWKADIINNRKKIMLFPTNISCLIRIKLRADGKLALVKIERSSGNPAYDAFSEQAIYRSEPFKMPTDPVANKELTETDHLFEFDDSEFNED